MISGIWNVDLKCTERATCLTTQFLTYLPSDWYVSIRTNLHLRSEQLFWKIKWKQHLAGRRREHGRGCLRQSRESEQGEARRASSTPNGGPHLELARLRLNTWCKTISRLLTQHVTHHHTCVYITPWTNPISIDYCVCNWFWRLCVNWNCPDNWFWRLPINWNCPGSWFRRLFLKFFFWNCPDKGFRRPSINWNCVISR